MYTRFTPKNLLIWNLPCIHIVFRSKSYWVTTSNEKYLGTNTKKKKKSRRKQFSHVIFHHLTIFSFIFVFICVRVTKYFSNLVKICYIISRQSLFVKMSFYFYFYYCGIWCCCCFYCCWRWKLEMFLNFWVFIWQFLLEKDNSTSFEKDKWLRCKKKR